MTQNPEKSIHDNVVSAIQKGQIAMRPKWQFVLRGIFLVAGIVLTALALVYFVSFAVFTLRLTGAWFAPGFGFRGVGVFFGSLPWLIVILAVFFILLLEILVKQYAFAYRKPLLYSVIGVIVFTILGSAVVAQTSLHSGLREWARSDNLPLAGGLYRGYGMMRPGNVEAGVVTEKTETGYRVQSPRDELVNVIVTPETDFPFGADIEVDDDIVVIGQREDGSIKATAIRRMDDSDFPVPLPGHMNRMK